MTTDWSVHEIVTRCVDLNNSEGSLTIPISRQVELLGIARSSVYYHPIPIGPEELILQNQVDELYTQEPSYGSRTIKTILNWERKERGETPVGRKQIQTIMRRLGIAAIYPGPNLSKNGKQHPRYPYLLRGIPITHPNQVWGTDITYIRMAKGFVYLTAIMDWYSRYVLSWQISTSLETSFCIEAARRALEIATPEIMNTDQGVQYTSEEWIQLWEATTSKISMDGRRRFVDNIFVERLWRSVKYQEVYLNDYQTVMEAIERIGKYFKKYNTYRPHQSLQNKTPAEVYFGRQIH